MRWLWVAVGVLSLAVAGLGYEVYDLRRAPDPAPALASGLTALSARVDQVSDQAETTRRKAASLDGRLSDLDGGLGLLGNVNVADLANQVDGLDTRLAQVESEIRSFNTCIQRIRSAIALGTTLYAC